MNWDQERRYPEQDDENERDRAKRAEHAMERAERMRDEMIDRLMEEQRDEEREGQP